MKKAVLILAILFAVFGIGKADASVILDENFDSYSNGSLYTQNPLWNDGSTTAHVTNAEYKSSPKSVLFDEANGQGITHIINDLSTSSLPYLLFYYYGSVSSSIADIYVSDATTSSFMCYIALTTDGSVYLTDNGVNMELLGTSTLNVWHRIFVFLNMTDENCFAKLDEGSYSDFVPMGHTPTENPDYVFLEKRSDGGNGAKLYYDSIYVSDGEISISDLTIFNFDNLDFVPIYPEACTFNYVAASGTMAFTAEGRFTNPQYKDDGVSSSTLVIEKAYICLADATTNNCYDLDDLDNTQPASMVYYVENVTSTWPAADVFRVYYYIKGYYTDTGEKYEKDLQLTCNTTIGSTVPVGGIDWWGTATTGEWCVQDDCSASTSAWSVERFTCGIGNIAKALICPSPDVLKKSKGILDDLGRNKFPMNYIRAISTAFASGSSTISATTTGTSTYATDSINGSDYYAIAQLDVFTSIRTALSYFLMIAFGFWLISWSAKVFKQ